jgi:putative peptide zinc metalloprotease protein
VAIHIHRYHGKVWYVLRDLFSGRSYRLAPATYLFVAMMDGDRTLDDIWLETVTRVGDGAPTQDDIIKLLSQLHVSDLLKADCPPDAQELFGRFERKELSRIWQVLLNPMSIKIPLWDPDRFLERTAPYCRWVFSWVGATLWLLVVGRAVALAAEHWTDLANNAPDRILSAQNLLLISLLFPPVKLLHELGHAFAVKCFGGEVHELGVMFLVLVPSPYVDASAATGWRSKYRRALVGMAGIMTEVFVAALALELWLHVEPGLVRAAAFNVMLIAGVSTIVFNGNPLLRYDGYYVLSDLIEIPNLASRSNQYWSHLLDRYVFALPGVGPMSLARLERWSLFFYGPASFVYRLCVIIGIALYIAQKYMVIGVALAIWNLCTGVALPAWKAVRQLFSNQKFARQRSRVVATSSAAFAGVCLFVGFVPWPSHTFSEGVVWLPEASIIRAGTDGFYQLQLAGSGTRVRAGDTIAQAEDSVLDARIKGLDAKIAELEIRASIDRVVDRAHLQLTALELTRARAERGREELRNEGLIAKSRSDGTFIPATAEELVGRFVRQGEIVGFVTPANSQIVRVTVGQDDIDLVRKRLKSVRIKLLSDLSKTFSAKIVREVPAAQDELPSAALSSLGGGGLSTDTRAGKSLKLMRRRFQFDLEVPREAPTEAFGSRVFVRFEQQWEPLGAQWYRGISQLFLSRLHV